MARTAVKEAAKPELVHRSYTQTVEEVSRRCGIPDGAVRRVFEELTEVMEESLLSTTAHYNFGKFGTLTMDNIPAGRVRNPRAKPGDSNEFYMAPERKKVRFRPGTTFERRIKEHFGIGESTPLTEEDEA